VAGPDQTGSTVAAGAEPRRDPRAWFTLLIRGMAMGVAELVPGVSGGTIAFVTGIYYELVRTLSSFGPGSVVALVRDGPLRFWRSHNLGFLLVLGLGMGLSILAFARLFQFLLEYFRPVVWAFFFGLILACVGQIGRDCRRRALLSFGSVGLLAGLALLALEPVEAGASPWLFFLGGMAAISAWLLPAVSGSFLLLVFGLYEPVLRAINALDLTVLGALAAGCVVGVMLMARLLAWLMVEYREPVLALLTGFMAGSLVRLWPWQVDGGLRWPMAYQIDSGEPAFVVSSIFAVTAGMVGLWLLARLR
jgi:putative membrane protein